MPHSATPAWAPLFLSHVSHLRALLEAEHESLTGAARSFKDLSLEEEDALFDGLLEEETGDPDVPADSDVPPDPEATGGDGDLSASRAGSADTPRPAPDAAAALAELLPPPRPEPDFPLLVAALRLAMAFTAAETRALFAPGSITVIHAGPALAAAPVEEVITRVLQPAELNARAKVGAAAKTKAKAKTKTAAKARGTPGSERCLILATSTDSTYDIRQFMGRIRTALPERTPAIILLHDGVTLEADLAAILPPTRHLPPVDRAGFRALLGLRFPGLSRRSLTRLVRDLPDDTALARLGLPALGLAFRQSDPAAIVATLKHLVARQLAGAGGAGGGTVSLDHFDPGQEAVQVVRSALDDLARWRAGGLSWSEVPNGILLAGPPGTGKTWLARAAAATGGLPLVTATLGQWQTGAMLGNMLARMAESFGEAETRAPCIFFIDEIDAVGNRADRSHNSSYDDKVIAAFLTEIERIRRVEGVLLIAATNRLANIDAAVIRPGRFDAKVLLDHPTRAGIAVMLEGLLAAEGFPPEDIAAMARAALGLSAAEIGAVLRQARSACRATDRPLTPDVIIAALTDDRETSALDDQRIAIHEAGHALVAIRLGLAIDRINIGNQRSYVAYRFGRRCATRGLLETEIAVLCAGRAAEEILLGEASSGAGGDSGSDLAAATEAASAIEARYGLGDEGLVWTPADLALRLADPDHRARVEAHLARGLARARDIITAMPRLVDGLAEVLLRERELTGPALADWVTAIRDHDPTVVEEWPEGVREG